MLNKFLFGRAVGLTMRKIKFLTILYLTLCVPAACAQSGDDWQFWNSVYGEKALNPVLKISAEEESHLSGDFGKLSYYHADIGLIYAMKDWLNLGVNYRFIRAIQNDFWENEYRPHFNATVFKTWQAVTLSNRSRMEQRILSHTKDLWRYRNQTKLVFDLKTGERSIKPYWSHEFFFDLDQPEFDYIQFSGGVEKEITENFSVDFHYLRQDGGGRGTEPKAHVLGVGANFYF